LVTAKRSSFGKYARPGPSFPDHLEQTEIRRFHAMMLLIAPPQVIAEKVQTLLREALESYTQIGMPRHIEMARVLLN
jgi:hypothetical protein